LRLPLIILDRRVLVFPVCAVLGAWGWSVKLGDPTSKAASGETVPVSSTGANIYFARSAASASRYVKAIIATGRVGRPSLGVSVVSTNFQRYLLPRQGVMITEVATNGQGRLAFQPGDVVTSIVWSNGYRYATPDEGSWNDALSMIQPGQIVTLRYYRLSESGAQAVVALREASAAELSWFEVKLTAPGMTVAQAVPAGTLPKIGMSGLKS
jgi:hypothetical protein